MALESKATGRRGAALARLVVAAVAAACALGWTVPLMRLGLNFYDEGVMAVGAEQLLKGHWPAIDFYVPYPPAAFYALAVLYRLAGVQLLVERALSVGLVAACGCLGCLLVTGLRRSSERHTWGELGAAAGVLAVMGLALSRVWVTPVAGGALCLVLAGGLVLRAALPGGHPVGAVATGLVFGLAALWRPDFALYGAAAAGCVWLLRAGHGRPAVKRPSWRQRVAGAAAVGIGAAVVALPAYGLIVMAGGQRAFQSLLVWPIASTQLATLPWPPLTPHVPARWSGSVFHGAALLCENWAFYFPLAALVLGAWRLLRRRTLAPAEVDVALWLLLASGCFYLYASRRADYYHLLPLLVLALLFTALCLAGALGERPAGRSRPRALWLASGAMIALPALGGLVPAPLQHWVGELSRPAHCRMELPGPRGAGIFVPRRYARQYGRVLEYLSASVPEDERIYVGAPRHDRFTINDPLIYFLAGRDPGTYFWCLDSGVTTTHPVQLQIRRELTANGVNTVVLWTDAAPDRNNAVLRSPGATTLDQMLATEFSLAQHLPSFRILRRTLGGTAPQAAVPPGSPLAGGQAETRLPGQG